MCFDFAKNMKYFILILVLCSGLLSQSGLTEKLESREQLLDELYFNLDNEAYNQKNHGLEDPFLDNAACICRGGTCVEEDGKEVCKCPPGFGNFTSSSCKECNCGPGVGCYWGSGLGGKTCLCKPGYYIKSSKCEDCECGSAALTCEIVSQEWFKPDKKICKCQPGSQEKDGKCVACDCKGGTCVMEDGKEICKCPPGFGNFTSSSCKECNCGPGIECYWGSGWSGKKTCLCKPGYYIKISKCEDCECGPGAITCEFVSNGWNEPDKKVCKCQPGYNEEYGKCVGACSKNPCENGGTCKDVETGYECLCPSNYSGKNCTALKGPCNSNPCQNKGTCEVEGQSFKCNCPFPFRGETCEISPCNSSPCQNKGKCEVEGQSFKCICQFPFSGKTCEIGPCNSNPCQNKGVCEVDGQSFKCKCPFPFRGETCEIGSCSSNPCQNNGTCKVLGQNFKCECKEPFEGKNCEIGPCSSNPCHNNGKCEVDKLSFKCVCSSPFAGKHCEIDPCTSKPCLNSGNCTFKGNSFNCKCQDPFFGDKCEKNPCSPNPCGNGGKCKTKGKSFTCECPDDFFGETCQHECDCKNGECRVSSENDVICECLPEYGKKSDVCTVCECGTGANCAWEKKWLSLKTTKYCLCPDGSRLEEKHCEETTTFLSTTTTMQTTISETTPFLSTTTTTKPTTMSDICNDDLCEHGKCEIVGRFYRCRCFEGFTGLRCEDRVQNKSDNLTLWQIIQTSILAFVLILLLGVFCFLIILLRRQK